MIILIKKLLFLTFVCFFCIPLWAFSSSSFLISQSAFKNYDYSSTLFDFSMEEIVFSNTDLLNKVIAAIITEDLNLANKIANEILLNDNENQEAYIVKLTYLVLNKNYNEIEHLNSKFKNKNGLIDFIFFKNSELKDKT